MPSKKTSPPWERKAPKGTSRTPLSPADKRKAKAMAKKAGRSYPNLIDNVRVARKKRKR